MRDVKLKAELGESAAVHSERKSERKSNIRLNKEGREA